jgi:antitoxin (DNA-binding transcriptional repressor) of toxin-antitoxin stability system
MRTVNMHEAKSQLSALVGAVLGGETAVLGRDGKAVARLIPYEEPTEPLRPGCWKRRLWVAPDFDETRN